MDDSITYWIRIVWSIISGAFMTVLGYFLPVKNIIHLLVFFFLLDVIFGYLAARKLRKERFSTKIIWNTTIPRMLFSIVLIAGTFMWDEVYRQTTVSTYTLIGWFISGLLLASIAINMYHITKWDVFLGLGKYFTKRASDSGIEQEQTGNA